MESSVHGNKYATIYLLQFFHHYFIALLLSSRFNLHVSFRLFCQNIIIEMPSLIRKEKITFEYCGTQTTRNKNVRHKKSCSPGTLYCTQCPIFSTKSQSDLNYYIAKNWMSPSGVTFVIKSFQDFTPYVNMKTLKTECKSDQEQKMWMWNIYWEMLRITCREKSCIPVNISWWIRNLKGRDTRFSITQWKLSTYNCDWET